MISLSVQLHVKVEEKKYRDDASIGLWFTLRHTRRTVIKSEIKKAKKRKEKKRREKMKREID